MEKIVLFDKIENCCGCGACQNVCPQNAISMNEDENGFLFPQIDHKHCIHCEKCKNVCAFQNENTMYDVIESFAAADQDNVRIMNSASGGVFGAIAHQVLLQKGSVFGCAFEVVNGKMIPVHEKVSKQEDLHKVQGSKYVQSETRFIYRELKEELSKGEMVVFSGTPCQIAACRRYLGKNYSNLLLVDIICHGVPSSSFFNDYIHYLNDKINGNIIDFCFRDKFKGWGYKGYIKYKKNGVLHQKHIYLNESSFYSFFLHSDICRESCFTCKYAAIKRVGDITIGDYWGIQKQHPEYININGGPLDERKGISCVLVNTIQGKEMMKKFGLDLLKLPSSIEQVAKENAQLNQPSRKSPRRDMILQLYHSRGYSAVDKWYFQQMGVKRFLFYIWWRIPETIREWIKKGECLTLVPTTTVMNKR